jgi:6-phosphogluconolactonase
VTIPSWVHIGDIDALAVRLATMVQSVAVAAVTQRGTWSIAIPGGSVVERLLPALARADLPWDRAHVFWCDERVVPAADPRSNQQALLALGETVAQLRTATLHPMPTEDAPARAAERYAEVLRRVAGDPPRLDVVLLGTGEDGHVASLFPRHAAMEEAEALVVVEEASPKPPPQRLSLTWPVLAGASLTVVAAFGAGKRDAVRAAIDAGSDLPVARVLHRARQPLLLADLDAAAHIR